MTAQFYAMRQAMAKGHCGVLPAVRRRGGFTAQIYAMRQAIAEGIVAYHQKFGDEATKKVIKDACYQKFVDEEVSSRRSMP